MSTLTLYQNSAEPQRMDKTNYLTQVATITGTIEPSRDTGNLMDLNVVIEYSQVPNFNYVHIDSFSRYYFVVNISLIANNLYNISLHEDVLFTHKTNILNLNALIERTSNVTYYDKKLMDSERIAEQGNNVEILDVTLSSSPFDSEEINSATDYVYILGTI